MRHCLPRVFKGVVQLLHLAVVLGGDFIVGDELVVLVAVFKADGIVGKDCDSEVLPFLFGNQQVENLRGVASHSVKTGGEFLFLFNDRILGIGGRKNALEVFLDIKCLDMNGISLNVFAVHRQ